MKWVLISLKALWIPLLDASKSLHTSRSHCLKILIKYFGKRSVMTWWIFSLTAPSPFLDCIFMSKWRLPLYTSEIELQSLVQYCYVAAEEKEMSSENLSCTLPLPSQPPSKPQSHFQPLLLLFWVAPPTSAAWQLKL